MSCFVITSKGNGPSTCAFLIFDPVTTTFSRTTAPSSFSVISSDDVSSSITCSTEVSEVSTTSASSTTGSSPGLSARRNVDRRPTLKNVNKFL